jgi:hypothetical protein
MKPKKKKINKKGIYQEASASDSNWADEVEIVKVKKQQKPLKQQNQQEPQPQPKPQINNNSYSDLLYESSIDKLKFRMMEDRAKYLVQSVLQSYS